MTHSPDIDDLRAAAVRLDGIAVRTPLLNDPLLDAMAGRRVLIKAECLQVTGSFKFRGAWNALASMDADARARGVVAYSSGNHAQAVAHAATRLGVAATIVMPDDAPAVKLENTRALGASVVTYDRRGGESREAVGEALAERHGYTLIRPYDDPAVIAGQGTCGLEIAAQARALGVVRADVLVCCGGGGLTSGVALALEAEAPGLRARPVEPATADDVCRSLVAGERVANSSVPASICDAIVTPMPGEQTFPIMARLCGPGLTVSDDEALGAMRVAAGRLKLVAEPGGAVALAAALADRPLGGDDDGDAVIVVLSGGNVDPAVLARALSG